MMRNLERLRRHSAPLFSHGPMILMYHHVGDAAPGDPWRLAVSPRRFREQLSVLRRDRTPMRLSELVRRHAAGQLPRDAVAITFDDGYTSNLQNAKPALEAMGIPATVFVTSGFVDRQDEPWWDQLAALMLGPTTLPEQLNVPVDGRTLVWREQHWSPRRRVAVHRDIHRLLVWRREPEQRRVLDLLKSQVGALPNGAAGPCRTMSTHELRELAAGDAIEIGAHTVTHPSLSRLPRAPQHDEIAACKRALEAILDRRVDGFSYPYGDYDAASMQAVSESGYRYACTSTRGFVHPRDNALKLPRLMVEDWGGEEFARRFTASNRLARLLPRPRP